MMADSIITQADLDGMEARATMAGGADSRWRSTAFELIVNSYGHIVCRTCGGPGFGARYAEHIAGMDPPNTLKLLSLIREQREEIARLQLPHDNAAREIADELDSLAKLVSNTGRPDTDNRFGKLASQLRALGAAS